MSTLGATVSMMKTLPEEDLLAIHSIVQRFMIKEKNPYKPLSKEETLEKLARSRKHASEGKVVEPREAVREIKGKYGLARNSEIQGYNH